MTDKIGKLRIAHEILPGFGAFGFTELSRLSVPIGMDIDQINLTINAPQPEFLNLFPPIFYDENGEEISNKDICTSVSISSALSGDSSSNYLDRFLSGAMLHSALERSPTLTIRLGMPIFISRIDIPTRDDAYHRRARHLTVHAFSNDMWCFTFDNLSPTRLSRALDILLDKLKLSHVLTRSGSVETVTKTIESATTASLLNYSEPWSFHDLLNLLPVFSQKPEMTKMIEAACARILLICLNNWKTAVTTNLKLASAILSTPSRIQCVADTAMSIQRSSGNGDRQIVISKHHIHYAKLIEKKEIYLNAITKAIPILEDMGMQPMLCYGTLLGARREQAFLAHDDDVDLLCYFEANSHSDAKEKKQQFLKRLIDMGFATWDTGENFQVTIEGASLDLFICWQEGSHLHLMMENFAYRHVDKDCIIPRSEIKLYDRTYPAPARPDDFLRERYGDTWSIADPYHEWPWPVTSAQG